jgi:hypothetical protein
VVLLCAFGKTPLLNSSRNATRCGHKRSREESNGTLTTAFERMQPIGVSNCYASIAVPFGCKVIAQVPKESTLCPNSSLGDRAVEGIYVGFDDSTECILAYIFKTKKIARFSDWKAFPRMFPFRDPDVVVNKRDFTEKDAKAMYTEDASEEQAFVAENTRSRAKSQFGVLEHAIEEVSGPPGRHSEPIVCVCV